MITPEAMPQKQDSMPPEVTDFIASFMRSLNNARLYSRGHDLLRQNIEQLDLKFQKAAAEREFIFLGCAKDTFFFEGSFYGAKDLHLQKFLQFFHSLRISNIFLDKEITPEGFEMLMGLLAGAKPGQGEEVSGALERENVKYVKLGLIDYSIFSTVQNVASNLSQSGEDEAVWRQLIMQPAAAGTFKLSPKKMDQLSSLAEDVENLKGLLLQLDKDITESQETVTASQRGMLLGNLIQNIGDTLAGFDYQKRKLFAQKTGNVLEIIDPKLKNQILGSTGPDDMGEEKEDVIHEIIDAMPDSRFIYLLADALKNDGPNSICFRNLFKRALVKYKEPSLLIPLIKQEMDKATREEKPEHLKHWKHLEQLLIQHQETDELNSQYNMEIEAFATSIQLQEPMVEEDEMTRLLKTIQPESLGEAKARLIIDAISSPHPTKIGDFLVSIVEDLGGILGDLFKQEKYPVVGSLLREIYLVLSEHPMEESFRKALFSAFSSREIQVLLKVLLGKCRRYQPDETKTVDAVCQLYPEKSGAYLLELFMGLDDEDNPQSRWLTTTLASLSYRLGRVLGRQLEDANVKVLPRLLSLIGMSGDQSLRSSVEQLIGHQNHDVRLKVIHTLGKLKAERIVSQLGEILLQKPFVMTKKVKALQNASAKALAEIGSDEARALLQTGIEKGSGEIKALCKELL